MPDRRFACDGGDIFSFFINKHSNNCLPTTATVMLYTERKPPTIVCVCVSKGQQKIFILYIL